MKKIEWKCKGFIGYKNITPELIGHFYGIPNVQLHKMIAWQINRVADKYTVDELIDRIEFKK